MEVKVGVKLGVVEGVTVEVVVVVGIAVGTGSREREKRRERESERERERERERGKERERDYLITRPPNGIRMFGIATWYRDQNGLSHFNVRMRSLSPVSSPDSRAGCSSGCAPRGAYTFLAGD